MGRWWLCLLTFVGSCSLLFPEEAKKDEPTQSSSASPEAPPSSFVNSVQVTSGAFFFSTTDFTVSGPAPLTVSHHYNSDTSFYGWMGHSSFASNFPLFVDYSDQPSLSVISLLVDEGNGSLARYEGKERCKTEYNCFLNKEYIKKHFTNAREGKISGRTNPKNNVYRVVKKHLNGSWWWCEARLSDGMRRYFHSSKYNKRWMNLSKEILGNGNKLEFTYSPHTSKKDRIKEIVAKNHAASHEFGKLSFSIDKEDHKAFITASNGKAATYSYFEDKENAQEKIRYIEKIVSTDAPTVKFHYIHTNNDNGQKVYRIDRINWPENRFLELVYDDNGKVIAQKAPCGNNGEKRTIQSFEYHPHMHVTYVRDAFERKTTYRYSSQKRITEIKKYFRDSSLFRAEYFHWGTGEHLHKGHKDVSDEGNLLSKAIIDGTEKGVFCWKAKYDDDGNIIKETIYGNLSGTCRNHFKVTEEAEPKPDDVEAYHKYATFSEDRFHLKLSEFEDDGPKITYKYQPHTDLLLEKLVWDQKTIKLREFYTYNEDAILVEKIVDDGSTNDKTNFRGVTERKILRIRPVQTSSGGYGIGQPAEIQELCVDLSTDKEQLLKRTTYTYDKGDHLTQQKVYDGTNSLQYTLQFSYDDKGRLIAATDAIGRTCLMAYDENGNKIREEFKTSGSFTTSEYDSMNHLTTQHVHYDTGEVFITEHKYDLLGNLIKKIDHFGNVTEFAYDDFNRCILTICPKTEAGQAKIKREYDIFNNITSETDANGHTTTITRNIRGAPVTITYSDGSVEGYEYYLNGSIKCKIEKNGLKRTYVYDFLHRPIEEKVSDSFGKVLYTIKNRYSAFHLMETVDAMGYVTSYAYDAAGRKIEEKKTNGDLFSRTTYLYDSMGRIAETREWSSSTEFIATCFSYDTLNRVVLEEHKSGNSLLSKECYTYDFFGNKTCIERFKNANESFSVRMLYNSKNLIQEKIDEAGNKTTFTYNFRRKNQLGQYVQEVINTDPLGQQTVTCFDALKRPVSVQKKKGSLLLAAASLRYDRGGNKILQEEAVIVNGKQERVYTIAWSYDGCNRPTEIVEQPGSNEEKKIRKKYNPSGSLKYIQKPNGVTLSHTYDALERLVEIVSSENSVHYVYSYDLNNNILAVEDKIHAFVQHKTYDAWNRISSEEFLKSALRYSYDPVGRVTSYSLPDSSSVFYLYAGGHLSDVVRRDLRGAELYRHSYSKINLQEEVEEHILPFSSGKITTTWDIKGRAVDIHAPLLHEEIASSAIDAGDNVREVRFQDAVGRYTNSYTYDDLYQLSSEAGMFDHTYTNDSIANRRMKDRNAYTIDFLNRLQATEETIFTYDRNGNMLSSTCHSVTTRYKYDALDRLTGIENGLIKAEYIYDASNRRLAKKVSQPIPGGWEVSKDERYFYIGAREVGSVDENGIIQELRILGRGKGADIGASVALELRGSVFIPVHDGRGDIIELLSSSGSIEETIHYSAFGEYSIFDKDGHKTDQSLSPWLFLSKRIDEESGFFYFGSRYYSAAIGRWITPDPLGFADGPNLYAYVHNSPLLLLDLYGMLTEEQGASKADPAPPTEEAPSAPAVPPSSNATEQPSFMRGPTVYYFDEFGNRRSCRSFIARCGKNNELPTVPDEYKGYNKPCVVEIIGPNGPLRNDALAISVNGFNNTLTEAIQHGNLFSIDLGGHNVTCVYNNSTGIAGVGRLIRNLFGFRTTATGLLGAVILAHLEAHPNAQVVLFGHSQGTAQIRIATRDLGKEYPGQISIFGLAPTRYVEKGNHLRSVKYVVSRRDLYVRALRGVTRITSREISRTSKAGSVTFVDPAEGAPLIDHDMESSSYKKETQDFCDDFLNNL